MTRPESPTPLTTEAALALLTAPGWAPSDTHIPTAQSGDVVRALLPVSRTAEGRQTLLANAAVIPSLVCVLRDPMSHREPLGERAVRLLRNLCVRSPSAQEVARVAAAHVVVLHAVLAALTASNAADRLRRPFITFAAEFLVNFVTGNRRNADAVWGHAYPVVFDSLLRCPNPAVVAAAAALVHNCLVAAPALLADMTKPWVSSEARDSTLVHTLVHLIQRDAAADTDAMQEADDDDDRFFWAFSILRRLIRAGCLRDAFNVLGPAIDAVLQENIPPFTTEQTNLLHIVDAGASRCAEVEPTSDLEALIVPDSGIAFFAELLEVALQRRAGEELRLAASIVGSIVIVNDRQSDALDILRVRSVRTAVAALRAIHDHDAQQKLNNAKVNAPASTKTDGSQQTPAMNGSDSNGDPGEGNTDSADEGVNGAVTGLRGMLIRAVAICVDGCRTAQDAVRAVQGIPVVLSALAYESDVKRNPFLREWAVLAVRNLTANNAENAREISELELVGLQQDEELLQKTGLEAVMNERTGKPCLRVRGSSAGKPPLPGGRGP